MNGKNVAAGIAVLLCFTAVSFGQGFRNPPPGDEALSQAGAFTAQADDASAVYFNPAGLVQLKKSQWLISSQVLLSNTVFSNGTVSVKKENGCAILGSLYLAYVPDHDKWRFGLGITSPYGQKTEWDPSVTTTIWHYQVPYYSSMEMVDVSPVVAFPVNENLSLGMGLEFYQSSVETRQIYPWSMLIPLSPDGIADMKGDGTATAGTLGILYKKDRNSVGFSWHSGFSMNYKGNFSVSELPVPVQMMGFQQETDSTVNIKFPNIYSLGYMWTGDKLKIQAQAELVQYSVLKNITVDAGPDNGLLNTTTIAKNWTDAWDYYLGTSYRLSSWCVLKGGLGFIQSPVPDATFDPTLPDSNRFVATLGTTFNTKAGNISITYLFSRFNNRNIQQGGATDGTYKTTSNFIGLEYSRTF